MEIREPSPSYKKVFISIQEYLDQEKKSVQKHEYYQGEVFAMAGAGSTQNVLFKNIFIALG
jgi:hypothetical protein